MKYLRRFKPLNSGFFVLGRNNFYIYVKKSNYMATKDKSLTIRIPEKLLEDFKLFCDEKSMNVSKRIRRYMEIDIENWKTSKIKKSNTDI